MKKISERTPVTLVNGELVRVNILTQPSLVSRLETLLDKLPEGSEQRQEFVCQLNIFLNVFENMYALDEDDENGCPCDCSICDEDCDDYDEEDDDDEIYYPWLPYDEDEFDDEDEGPILLSSLEPTDEKPKRTRVKLVDGELIEITDEEDDDDEDSTDYDDEALADFFVELLTSMRSK